MMVSRFDKKITSVTRKDGSVQFFKGKSTLVGEKDTAGRSVARVLVTTSSRGNVVSSKPVSSGDQLRISQQLQKTQESINKASKALNISPSRVVGEVDPRSRQLFNFRIIRNGKSVNIEQFNKLLLNRQKELRRRQEAGLIAKENLPKFRETLSNLERVKIVEEGLKVKAPTILRQEFETFKTKDVSTPIRVKGKFTSKVVKEFLPFVNDISLSAYKKINTGDSKSLTFNEKASIIFDFVTLIPLGGLGAQAVRVGVKGLLKVGGVQLGRVALTKTTNNLLKRNVGAFSRFTRLGNITKVASVNFGISIIKDLGFFSRAFNSAKEFYQVDKKVLGGASKKLGIDGTEELLRNYNGFIAKELKDGNLNFHDYTNFIGVTTASRRHVIRAQNNYKTYLLNNGFSRKEMFETLGNIENLRRARALGQLFGLTKIEISSDRLVNQLIKQGVGKKKAITVGVVREGISTIVSESFVQGLKLEPSDLFLAVAIGVPYSIWASKQKGKIIRVNARAEKRVIKKIVKATIKKLSNIKINKYTDKVIQQSARLGGQKLSSRQIRSIRFAYSPSERLRVAKAYIKSVIIITRQRKKPLPVKFKEEVLLRDPIVNFFDPFEFLGDKVQDLSDSLTRKLRRGLKKAKSKTKTKKVKKLKKGKVKIKTLAKLKPQPSKKLFEKTKFKPKPKPRPKPKPKPKPRPKPKPKPRPKPRPKPKPIAKTLSFGLLLLKKKARKENKNISYDAVVKKNGVVRRIRFGLPFNKAKAKLVEIIDNSLLIKGSLIPKGVTSKRDLKKKLSKGFSTKKDVRTGAVLIVENSRKFLDTKRERRLFAKKQKKKGKKKSKKKKMVKKRVVSKKKRATKQRKR